jgi:ubiquinone/menaquinone biosynthesis C-methylase UbiE
MNDRVLSHTEAHKLEDPQRLRWLPPAEILSHLPLAPGMKIADVGAGTGYFSIPMARAVGESGEVYAVDLQQEMLDFLGEKLAKEGAPGNISLLRGNASHLPLPASAAHLTFYANVWHELENHDTAFAEALRISVSGGKIAILDWRDDVAPPPGPPQEHRISSESLVSFLNTKGCRNVGSRHVGQYGYLVTAELNRPDSSDCKG